MFIPGFLLFTLGAFLTGGGVHGVVVSKSVTPVTDSLGAGGICRLELRAADQQVHRQMVSAEVFAAYEVGDEFDDRATLTQIRERHASRLAREQAEADRQAMLAAAAEPKEEAIHSQVASLFLQQDRLPETEGF